MEEIRYPTTLFNKVYVYLKDLPQKPRDISRSVQLTFHSISVMSEHVQI